MVGLVRNTTRCKVRHIEPQFTSICVLPANYDSLWARDVERETGHAKASLSFGLFALFQLYYRID